MKMKDKKFEQNLKIEELRRKRKEEKSCRKESEITRVVDTISKNPKILITCEGKNTEKDYFSKFRISTIDLEVIGVGDNTISLVNKTISKRDERKEGYYDEVWCVFDADPKPNNPKQLQNFNEAIWLAERNDINVAYSHQAFEYWLLLHFNDYQGEPMDRKLYKSSLNKFLKNFNLKYDDSSDKRGKSISNELFDVLMAKTNGKRRISLAIERAKRIYNNLPNLSNPGQCESSTTVFKLVERLFSDSIIDVK